MTRRGAFTLIELLMVVLIVGVLASVAIPTYAGHRDAANETHATSRLETALRTVRAAYTNNDTAYPDAATLAAQIAADQPALAAAGAAFTSGEVRVEVVDDQRVVLRTQSKDRTNFMIVDDRSPDGRQTSRLRSYRRDPAGLSPITNVANNPGFESGTLVGSWTTQGGGHPAAAPTTVGCWRGTYCTQRGVTVGGLSSFAVANNGGGRVAVAPATKVAVRCAVRMPAGAATGMRVYIEDFDAGMSQVPGSGENVTIRDMQAGKWYEAAAIITATGNFVNVTARLIFPEIGAVGEVDDCMLVIDPAGEKIPAYFDGSYGGGRWVAGPNSTATGYLAERAGPEW